MRFLAVKLALRPLLIREADRRWRGGLLQRVGLWLGVSFVPGVLGGSLGVKWLVVWCGIPHDGFPFLKFPVPRPMVIDYKNVLINCRYKNVLINYRRLALCGAGGQGAASVSSASPASISAACLRSPSSVSMR